MEPIFVQRQGGILAMPDSPPPLLGLLRLVGRLLLE